MVKWKRTVIRHWGILGYFASFQIQLYLNVTYTLGPINIFYSGAKHIPLSSQRLFTFIVLLAPFFIPMRQQLEQWLGTTSVTSLLSCSNSCEVNKERNKKITVPDFFLGSKLFLSHLEACKTFDYVTAPYDHCQSVHNFHI